jgi:hypothetical protein
MLKPDPATPTWYITAAAAGNNRLDRFRAAFIEVWGEIMVSKKTHWILVVVCSLLLFSGCKTVISDFRQSISSPRAELQADEAYESADYAKAFPLYLEAAQAGRSYSQFMVANMYLQGEGIREDENAGFEWMRLAAEGGYSPAIYCLGVFSLTGYGVEQDFTAAANYFEKAALQEHGLAMLALGTMRAVGLGVEKDSREAVRWFRLAKAHGFLIEDDLLAEPERVFEIVLNEQIPREISRPVISPEEQLRRVQQRLSELGYDPGPADGLMGPSTRKAIGAFQKDAGLPVNGQVTEETKRKLNVTF